MDLKEESWGSYLGDPVRVFTVTYKRSGFLVTITDLGATTLRVVLPDRHGTPGDVTLTQETPEDLINCGAYLGATIGRVANRIGDSKFSLEGKEYTLFANNGPHCLHGGKVGFDKRIWALASQQVTDHEVILKFSYVSPDLEEGFPGALSSSITYFIQPDKIAWEFEARTDKTTIVNLTNHNYWNLDGLATAIDDQTVSIAASNYSPIDSTGLSTGVVTPVEPGLDTRHPKPYSEIFASFGDVDNNFYLDEAKNWYPNQKTLYTCAESYSPKTGRAMTIKTSDPCVQLYTGNSLGIPPMTSSNGNHEVRKHYAFCLETQRPPNAINNSFKNYVILQPGETYYHRTEHEFKLR